jgi:hypothetical protein
VNEREKKEKEKTQEEAELLKGGGKEEKIRVKAGVGKVQEDGQQKVDGGNGEPSGRTVEDWGSIQVRQEPRQ